MKGYSDADWGGDLDEYQLSTVEAEYVACYFAAQEAIWLRSFLYDLNLTPRVDDHVEVMCNNTVVIPFTKDMKFHWKTKHIKRRYHFVRDTIKMKEVAIKYTSTSKMIADHLTKLIPRDTFKSHVISLGLHKT